MEKIIVRETKNGTRYVVQIRKTGFKIPSKTFTKLSEAEAHQRKVVGELERDEWYDKKDAKKKTLATILTDYKEQCAPDLKDKGVPARIDNIIKWFPTFSKLSILNTDAAVINDYIDMRYEDEVTGDTILKELGFMSAAITHARSCGLKIDNVINVVKKPKAGGWRDRRFVEGEYRRMLFEMRHRQRDHDGKFSGGVKNPYLIWVVRFAVETAMRRSEILALEWKHVFQKHVFIHKSKNGHTRNVPLSTRARRIIKVIKKIQKENPKNFVFDITVSSLKQAFDRACERAVIDDFRFHDLRHEATSRLAEKLDMLELSSVTGHRDPRMLKRYYHPKVEKLADKLG